MATKYGDSAYVTVQNDDGTYEWKRISSAGGGAVAYEELPLMDGEGSPGTVSEWARGDHVHPTDETRQDLLFGELGPNQNIKTVNNEPILGSGNIRIATLDGGEMNIIEEVDINGTPLKVDENKAVNLKLKTVDGYSIVGTGDLPIEIKLAKLQVGDYEYDGKSEVEIPLTGPIQIKKTLRERPETYACATKGTYCTGDIEFQVTPVLADYTITSPLTYGNKGVQLVNGNGDGYYTSPIDGAPKNAPGVTITTTPTATVNTPGWIEEDKAEVIPTNTYVSEISLKANSGVKIKLPDGTIWTVEVNGAGNVYTY